MVVPALNNILGKLIGIILKNSPVKLLYQSIGNGDLHQAYQVRERMAQTHCEALMIARGCLRNPFIFLESLDDSLVFTSRDYWEAIERLFDYTAQAFEQERTRLVQMRKLIVWV
jgi:tRNA-dihydrouridine synthase B